MSGLLRHTEGPDFKKAALVAVVTAGTGALVYSGYRYWQHSKLDKPSKEITPIEKETLPKVIILKLLINCNNLW